MKLILKEKKEDVLVMLINAEPLSNAVHTQVMYKNYPGIQVISMLKVSEAIEFLKNEQNKKPDLIILDLQMSLITEWDFIKEYNKLNLAIEVVIISPTNKKNFFTTSNEKTAVDKLNEQAIRFL